MIIKAFLWGCELHDYFHLKLKIPILFTEYLGQAWSHLIDSQRNVGRFTNSWRLKPQDHSKTFLPVQPACPGQPVRPVWALWPPYPKRQRRLFRWAEMVLFFLNLPTGQSNAHKRLPDWSFLKPLLVCFCFWPFFWKIARRKITFVLFTKIVTFSVHFDFILV